MITVIQRVSEARCEVEGRTTGACGKGLMLLVGAKCGDTEEDARLLAEKIAKLRIFSDENGKMNLSVNDVGGGALVVSNFTLLASYAHGNRPDYLQAEKPERAKELYLAFIGFLRSLLTSGEVGEGIFGADMKLTIVNDGPVTVVMDSEVLKRKK